MIIYKDVFTDDELISDSYNLKDHNAAVWKVNSKFVTKKANEDFGIAANTEEGEDTGSADPGAVTVNQIVDAFKLNEQSVDKKSFGGIIKTFMTKTKEHVEKTNPERVKAFQEGAQAFVKEILAGFADWQFFTGESDYEFAGAIVFQKFDGDTPVLYYFKDALKEMKV